jgi:hypothetical protein
LTYIIIVPLSLSNFHHPLAILKLLPLLSSALLPPVAVVAASSPSPLLLPLLMASIVIVAVIVGIHCHRPIIVVLLPLSYCCPQIAAIIVIDIITVGGSGRIIAAAVAVAIAIAVTITIAVPYSTIALVPVIVNVALLTLLCHHHCQCDPWQPIGGAGPHHASEALPKHADGAPTLELAAWGLAASTQGHYVPDVGLSKISWCLSNGGWS